MTKNFPLVSVILPVYNGALYLQEAIDSILTQSFRNIELIAINDGSTDDSENVLDAIADRRVRIIHQENMGLARTLNRGIRLANGKYVARQDSDDISLPGRIERQVAYLETHSECALLGTWSTIWEGEQKTQRGHRHPCDNGELQVRLLFDSFFVHSSVMIRRAALEEVGLYPVAAERNPPEDFDLWLRIARRFSVTNLPEVLLIYREVSDSISRSKHALLQRQAVAIAVENLQSIVSCRFPAQLIQDLVTLMRGCAHDPSQILDWSELERLVRKIEIHMNDLWLHEGEAVKRGVDGMRKILDERHRQYLRQRSIAYKLYDIARLGARRLIKGSGS